MAVSVIIISMFKYLFFKHIPFVHIRFCAREPKRESENQVNWWWKHIKIPSSFVSLQLDFLAKANNNCTNNPCRQRLRNNQQIDQESMQIRWAFMAQIVSYSGPAMNGNHVDRSPLNSHSPMKRKWIWQNIRAEKKKIIGIIFYFQPAEAIFADNHLIAFK